MIINYLKKTKFISLFILLIVLVNIFSFSRAKDTNFKIEGNNIVSDQTILELSGFNDKMDLTQEYANILIKNLNKSGLFKNVEVFFTEKEIKINVIENMHISNIFFEGNKTVSNDILFGIIKSKNRQPLNENIIFDDTNSIIAFYKERGKFEIEVTPFFINRKKNMKDLIFKINEGRTLEVNKIQFTGNKSFSDKKLRSIITSAQKSFFSFLSDRDNYNEDTQKKDIIEIERFYKSNGFSDIEIVSNSANFKRDLSEVNLKYQIYEGPRYIINDIEMTTNLTNVDLLDFKKELIISKGEFFNEKKLTESIENIERLGNKKGLPFLEVVANYNKDKSNSLINIKVKIIKGPQLFVEKINIRGNDQTLDKVIRREFSLNEGDLFDAEKLKKTEEKIKSLGYFEIVNISISEGSNNQNLIVNVEVKETSTGSLSFGAGYSTDTNLTGSLSVSENNFLGKGQKFKLQFLISENTKSLNFNFKDPSFLNKDLSAGINLDFIYQDPNESTYTQNSISFSPTFGFQIAADSRINLSYKLEELEIISDTSSSEILQNDDGKYLDSSLSLSLIYDKRNSIVKPTRGYIFKLNSSFLGLGGDTSYIKNSLKTKFYKGLLNDNLIFSAELEGGLLNMTNGYSRISDRFKLGGRNFRGFRFGEIGPRDISGDALGGQKYFVGRLETNFPLGLPEELGIYGGFFSEIGSLWDVDEPDNLSSNVLYEDYSLRQSNGFSIYWSTPIGPLQFNWSKPNKYINDSDITETFSLNLATRF